MAKHRRQQESRTGSHLLWFYNPRPARTGAISSTYSRGDAPRAALQCQPRRYLPRWSINNGKTHFSPAYLQSVWSSGQPPRFSEASTEPPSQGGLFTAQQTARSARSKCQGQRDHSPPPGNGAKVFAPDPGRWSSPCRTPRAAGSRPRSRSSERKTGSPRSMAKSHH